MAMNDMYFSKSMYFRKIFIYLFLLLLFPLNLSSQELFVISSKYLKCNDSVLVFTPENLPCSPKSETPLLFLLHGWSGNYRNWSEKADIQAISNKYGFIIVTPDGFFNSWYLNNADSSKMQWRTFFDKELYPFIMYKFNADPSRTFISGLSMGGHGALNVFIDNPARFRAAGSMSGVLNLMNTRLKDSQISKILGPYSDDSPLFIGNSAINRLVDFKKWMDYSPDRLYNDNNGKILLISCGAQDNLAKSSEDFCKKCDDLNIPNILILSPGVHSWKYWIYALDLHLFYFSRIANGSGLGF